MILVVIEEILLPVIIPQNPSGDISLPTYVGALKGSGIV